MTARRSIGLACHAASIFGGVSTSPIAIIRPAANPDPSGPAVSAPKTRHGELSKSEAAFYDEDADVLVLVTSGKKATSLKALG